MLPQEMDPQGVFNAKGLEETIRQHLKKNTEGNMQVFRTGLAHGRQG